MVCMLYYVCMHALAHCMNMIRVSPRPDLQESQQLLHGGLLQSELRHVLRKRVHRDLPRAIRSGRHDGLR